MATTNSSAAVAASKVNASTTSYTHAYAKANTQASSTTSTNDYCVDTTSSNSGGGGSNPLSFISTAVSFISNPIGTIVSLATGKK